MPTPDEEQLLESTKMSFGQHLEELRRALFKAILSLVVGFLVGLYFGRDIVAYVQTPLLASLERFYLRQAEQQELARLEQLKVEGKEVPDDLPAAAAAMARERLVPQDYLVSPRELAAALADPMPDVAEAIKKSLRDEADRRSATAPDSKTGDATDAGEVAAFPKREELVELRLYRTLEGDPRIRVVELGAEKPFVIYMKASLVAGFVFASPAIFYFIWEFIAAGLYRHEKKYIHIFLPLSLGLFISGAAMAFYLAFGYVLDFLMSFFEWMNIDPDLRLSDWMSFVLLLPLGFGIGFQLPLVMLALERIGLFTVESYKSRWRISVLVIVAISIVLSPGGDPYSPTIMAVPLVALYFFGIYLCKHMPGAQFPATDAASAPPRPGGETGS